MIDTETPDGLLSTILKRRGVRGAIGVANIKVNHYEGVEFLSHVEAHEYLKALWNLEVSGGCHRCFFRSARDSKGGCTRNVCNITQEYLEKGVDLRQMPRLETMRQESNLPIRLMVILTLVGWFGQPVYRWVQSHRSECIKSLVISLAIVVALSLRTSTLRAREEERR